MEKLVRYLTFNIPMEKLVRYSIFDIQMEKLVRSSIFDIQIAAVDHLIRVETFFDIRKCDRISSF